eukprot:1148544-Pelagomonas_calceolata.AAC.6
MSAEGDACASIKGPIIEAGPTDELAELLLDSAWECWWEYCLGCWAARLSVALACVLSLPRTSSMHYRKAGCGERRTQQTEPPVKANS